MLPGNVLTSFADATCHEAAGGIDVGIGKVRVLTLKSKLRDEVAELVAAHAWKEQMCKFQGVEADRMAHAPVGFGEIAAYVEVHDVVVVACVVSEQRCSAGIVEETLQSLGWRQQLMMKALLDNGVGNVSQHLWNMAVGRYIHAKFRARDNSSVVHLHCGYLQDVVLVDVQSRGLGIEDHNIALGSLGEALYIALAVTAQQVRWCHGP